MKEREDELGNKNREGNKKIMELEAKLEEAKSAANVQIPRVDSTNRHTKRTNWA